MSFSTPVFRPGLLIGRNNTSVNSSRAETESGAFANFAPLGGRAFANPKAILELLTRLRFPIRI